MTEAHRTEEQESPYLIDVARHEQGIETGIYVRARNSSGGWGSFDIYALDRDSLQRWLRSRGGENEWAEKVVFRLLGHRS